MKCEALKIANETVIPKCNIAQSFTTRFMGLMGKKTIPDDEALLFPGCNSIHTFFMRFSIDVVMLDRDGVVIEIIEKLSPWRMLMPRFKAKHVMELRAERSHELGIRVGTKLTCPGVWH